MDSIFHRLAILFLRKLKNELKDGEKYANFVTFHDGALFLGGLVQGEKRKRQRREREEGGGGGGSGSEGLYKRLE